MSHPEEYDVVVLGSGRGKLLAWTLASQGKRTAVVERRYVGGPAPTSPACRARTSSTAPRSPAIFRRGAEFGIVAGDWKVDMAAVRDRKRKMVDGLVAPESSRSTGRAARSSSWARGASSRRRPSRSRCRRRDADAPRPDRRHQHRVACPDRHTPGLAEARPLTHVEALELDRLPEHLIVLGGGYVGLELAQAFRRFGSRVTVVERNDALIHREDPDVTEAIERALPGRGDRGPDRDRRRSRRGEVRRVRAAARERDGAEAGSRGRTCSSPAAARRTPTASAWRRPGSRRTDGARQGRRAAAGRRPRASGRWATAPAARTSRTSARTTSAWCWPTSPAGTA